MDIIIEDGNKSSHIDSMLVCLFYNNFDMLNNTPTNNKFIYLQEIIKTKFIEQIKNSKIIFSYVMNELQNYLYFFGFSNKNPIDLFIFLFEKLNMQPIQISYLTSNLEKIEQSISHINLIATKDCSIKELYLDFIKNKEKIENFENNIKILNIPKQINFSIERKNLCKVDIINVISLFVNDEIKSKEIKWKFKALIGYNKDKYYSIIQDLNKKFYMIKNSNIPSKFLVDKTMIEQIKNEVIFVSYVLKKY
jgi:hypothetical protein